MPKRKPTPRYLVIDGCPCPYEVAAQVHMVLMRARQVASSIYRGDDPDAVRILHAHGKRDQAEIHADPALHDISNPPGQSQHDLHSDAVANKGPVGRPLEPWSVGVDSGNDTQASKDAIDRAAAAYAWRVHHPYSRGVEGHHWCFESFPLNKRRPWQWARIAYYRRTLPRS